MTMTSTKLRTYSELMLLPSFEERFEYLKLGGRVGESTFGFDRYLNQILYTSDEWHNFRRDIIIRDNGCDLAIPDRDINYRLTVHHLNPITAEDVVRRRPCVFDPENAICTAYMTHKAIHFGDQSLLAILPPERKPNDTCPWR